MKRHETLLRRLRADPRLFEDGPKAEQITCLIDAVKRRLQPAWVERAHKHQESRLERWFAIQ